MGEVGAGPAIGTHSHVSGTYRIGNGAVVGGAGERRAEVGIAGAVVEEASDHLTTHG